MAGKKTGDIKSQGVKSSEKNAKNPKNSNHSGDGGAKKQGSAKGTKKEDVKITEKKSDKKKNNDKPSRKHKKTGIAIRKKGRREKRPIVERAAFEAGYAIITYLDDLLDDLDEIIDAGLRGIFDVAAYFIVLLDVILDTTEWFIVRTYILFLRRVHSMRMFVNQYRNSIVQGFAIFIAVGTGAVALFASQVDYQYTYNGRVLGVVKEQRDVLEILDLVSEELSVEYGSNIVINPETDVTFEPILSYGKEIDDMDQVLRRFTYMGDIDVDACAIYLDDEIVAMVESEFIAQQVLDEVMNMYIDEDEDYISVEFTDNIYIKPYKTTLANVGSEAQAIKTLTALRQQEDVYKVVSGDTLSAIVSKLDTTMAELLRMNPGLDEDGILSIGQEIITQEDVPLLTVKTVKIETFAETIDYEVIEKESDSYYEGERVVAREGKKGKQRVTAKVARANGEIIEREDIETEIITEPVDKLVYKGTKKKPSTAGTGQFSRPVNVSVYRGYGMRWGRMHYGLDYAASTGTPIHAADGGVVVAVGWSGAYGYRITIDHENGYTTLYGHCSSMYVSVGDRVYKGQTIGAVGNTGRSTGPHCHFEIKKNGVNVNPANYV